MTHLWQTRNGNTVDIREMSESHIKNCIIILGRQVQKLEGYAFAAEDYAANAPDGAADAASAEATNYINQAGHARYWLNIFVLELERRGA